MKAWKSDMKSPLKNPANIKNPGKTLVFVSIVSALAVLGLQTSNAQVEFSALNRFLPDSLSKFYPIPALADDDVIFATDSLGRSLFANFASNRESGRVLVVDPGLGENSGLVWLSPEIEGRMEYLYAADINGDGVEELVLAVRKIGASGWSRLHIWSWSDSAASDIQRCGDTTPAYFSAPTRAQTVDTDDDGISEIILSAIGASGTDSLIYYWTDEGYCTKPK